MTRRDLQHRAVVTVSALPTASASLAGVIVRLSADGMPYWCDGAAWIAMATGSVASANDPYFTNVAVLLHMDGPANSTTFTDGKGHTFTAYGNASLSTSTRKFGTASGYFDGAGDYIEAASSADWAFGAGEFTIEAFINPSTLDGTQRHIISSWVSPYPFGIDITSSNLRMNINGAAVIDTAHGITTGAWVHIAATRSGSSVRLFVGGVQKGATASSSASMAAAKINIGVKGDNLGNPFHGFVDEVRITRVARYTSNFTPPVMAFPDA